MSRAIWKTPYSASTYIRYIYFQKNIKERHVEFHFFFKYFYYLVLNPNRFIYYNIFSRSSIIFRKLVGLVIRIYRGAKWRTLYLSRSHVGCKFGEFSKTRQRAVFRIKIIKKKTKPFTKVAFLKNLQIDRIRLLKSGKVRRQRIALVY